MMNDDKHEGHCCHCCGCCGSHHGEGKKWDMEKMSKEHLMEKKKFLEEKLAKIDKMIKEMK